ncbi:MAG: gliding motility protein GldM, partial [Chitinophagaceae bacterium]
MALPKEPRQKMINMMYLVLTALLALNVSAEILNAFKTVNRSLDSANGVLSANNNNIYASFAKKANEPESRQKAAIWQPKAKQVQALCATMYTRLTDLRTKVKAYGGYVAGKKDSLGYEANIDAATRLMDKEGEGPKLEKELAKLKKDLLSID